MSDAAALKAELRRLALDRRAAIDPDSHRAASARAVANLRALLRPGETVSLFWPIRGEIDPLTLVAAVRAGGGDVAMPVVEGQEILFRRFDGVDGLQHGRFGTRHPPPHEPQLKPDLIVAPLAAFDRRGGRIGYGAGFYDRAVARLRRAGHRLRVVGVAFACQEVERVPAEAHDEPLAAVATERELIETGAGA